MNTILYLSQLGGIFAILAFIHYFVDWIFQSHSEAMVKHNNLKIRAKHCFIYTIGFAPFLIICHLDLLERLISINVLFWSHFCLDTYHLVYLWAKYIRRPPEMTEPVKKVNSDGYVTVMPPDPREGFVQFVQTTLGKILMIGINQLSHLSFLWIIAYLIMRHL